MAATDPQSKFLQSYNYLPLLTTSSFRVLELLSGKPDDDIRIRLHQADWKTPPSYEAISYAWGDTNIKVGITCEDSTLEITPNLRDGLRQMRLQDRSRYLWADAICINQDDVSERGHQVSNMLKIYQNASLVLVWLGVDEDRHAEEAFKIIQNISEAACIRIGMPLLELRNVDNLGAFITQELEDVVTAREASSSSLYWLYTRP